MKSWIPQRQAQGTLRFSSCALIHTALNSQSEWDLSLTRILVQLHCLAEIKRLIDLGVICNEIEINIMLLKEMRINIYHINVQRTGR